MSKLGMFEEAIDPETGATYFPISGRAKYNTLKNSKTKEKFKSRHSNPQMIHWDQRRAEVAEHYGY